MARVQGQRRGSPDSLPGCMRSGEWPKGGDPLNTPRSLLSAAKAGDVLAARAGADWQNDQGDEVAALDLEIFSLEVEQRCIQARILRLVLARVPKPERAAPGITVESFLDGFGLSFVAVGALWLEGGRQGYSLEAPTDGQDTETVQRFMRWMQAAFPRHKFMIALLNNPLSTAGCRAMDATMETKNGD
jgi:hypothetical protein